MINSNDEEFINIISEQEICELHEAFNLFDINSEGVIPVNKLSSLLFSLKQYPTKEELEDILKSEGLDNSENLNFNQFLKILGKSVDNKSIDEDGYLKSLFDSLDSNNNGMISIHELRYIVLHSNEKITENEIELIMKNVDHDKDGLINFEEFLSIMKNWAFK